MSELSGISFPFTFGPEGGVSSATGAAKQKSNMAAIVYTNQNERLIRKAVGTIGYSLVLRTQTEGSYGAVKSLVEKAITEWVPSISRLSVGVSQKMCDNGNALILSVSFMSSETGEEFSGDIPLYE